MTEDLHKTTQQMIADYYNKDRKVTFAILGLAAVGVLMVILSAIWLFQSRQQLEQQQQQIVELQQQNHDGIEALQNQIGCVGQYFTQTDRANIRIANLDECSIQRIK